MWMKLASLNNETHLIVSIGTMPPAGTVFTNDPITSVHNASASGQVQTSHNLGRRTKRMLYKSTNIGFINTDLFLHG